MGPNALTPAASSFFSNEHEDGEDGDSVGTVVVDDGEQDSNEAPAAVPGVAQQLLESGSFGRGPRLGLK